MIGRKHLFELTPLGKADKEVRNFLEKRVESEDFRRYERSLNLYRRFRLLQTSLKILLYASIITAVATTFGFDQVRILQRIASYIGTSVLLVAYAGVTYITLIRKETYHVQREILISEAGE